MQFKVPQDVLRADKIVGFLTLRQLVIVSLGGGVTYAVYLSLSKQYFMEIWLPPTIFLGLVTAAFAFFKFHDIVFEKFILYFIEYKFRPHARTWQNMRGDAVLSVLQHSINKDTGKTAAISLTEIERRKKLEEMTKIVDTKQKRLSDFAPRSPGPEGHSESSNS